MAKVGKFCLAKRVKVEWLFQANAQFHFLLSFFLMVTFICFNRRCGDSPHTHMLSHHGRHGSRSRHLGLLCHALAEVSG